MENAPYVKPCVLDNTVPISAHFFLTQTNELHSDPLAEYCFVAFVDAFINAEKPEVLLPSARPGAAHENEPFVKLWHSIADKLPVRDISPELTYWAWLQLLRDAPVTRAEWVSMTAAQFHIDIDASFFQRVPNWEERLAKWLELLRTEKDEGCRAEARKLTEALEEALVKVTFHPRFVSFARSCAVSKGELALLRAFDWLQRGVPYAIESQGKHAVLHPLRKQSLLKPAGEVVEVPAIPTLLFGNVIVKQLKAKHLRRDSNEFVEKLTVLRRFVQENSELVTSDPSAAQYEALLKSKIPIPTSRGLLREFALEHTDPQNDKRAGVWQLAHRVVHEVFLLPDRLWAQKIAYRWGVLKPSHWATPNRQPPSGDD